MLDAVAKLVPTATRFMHQIAPSVVATLIAAGLISGYNHAFSGHLTQPRMAALHAEEAAPAPVSAAQATSTVPMTKPAIPVTEVITIHEESPAAGRVAEKDRKAEAGKDQTAVQVAAPLPPVRPAAPAKAEFKPEPRVASAPMTPAPVQVTVAPMTVAPVAPLSPAPVAAAPLAPPPFVAPPVIVAAPAVVPAEPPPVVTAKPYVTVPDRPNQRPTYGASLDDVPPPPPPQGPIGMIVNTLRPSALFARARAFGERIEAAGNDILPSIRPQ